MNIKYHLLVDRFAKGNFVKYDESLSEQFEHALDFKHLSNQLVNGASCRVLSFARVT